MSHRNVSDAESSGLYSTPRWPVWSLIEHGPNLPGGRWLEPCAGEGSICYAVNELRDDVKWCAVERDEKLVTEWLQPALFRGELAEVNGGDFFTIADTLWPAAPGEQTCVGRAARSFTGRQAFEVATGNPAFPDAVRFAEYCLARAEWTVLLERLDWLSGAADEERSRRAGRKPTPNRYEFFQRVGVPDVWVLPNRPQFKGRGQDSGDYAWFVWGPDTDGRVRHLPPVAPSMRSESRRQLRLA